MTWFTETLAEAVRICQQIADRLDPNADYSTIISEVAARFDVTENALADAWAYVEDMEQMQ